MSPRWFTQILGLKSSAIPATPRVGGLRAGPLDPGADQQRLAASCWRRDLRHAGARLSRSKSSGRASVASRRRPRPVRSGTTESPPSVRCGAGRSVHRSPARVRRDPAAVACTVVHLLPIIQSSRSAGVLSAQQAGISTPGQHYSGLPVAATFTRPSDLSTARGILRMGDMRANLLRR